MDYKMERLFRTHQVRRQESLNGIWEFQPVDEEVAKPPEKYAYSMSVPSCWEMTMPFCQYRGLAACRREIYLEKGENLRLLFKGISHSGTVYFDGEKVGFHYNAYTPFSIVIPKAEAGKHDIEVVVDNRFTEESCLHIPNDYYTYGGITRNAFLEKVEDCYIERMEFEPYQESERWKADVRIFVKNIGDTDVKCTLQVSCAGQERELGVSIPKKEEIVVNTAMDFEHIREWSVSSPNLYFLRAVLLVNNEAIDDLTDRVGFRTVASQNGKILLNGKEIFLKGINRHEDHGSCGCAIPLALLDADIKLIQEMGLNAVRTCHYPNDELFLDLCDENGILVWEESHDRGGDAARITNPRFIEQSMKVMHEMLEYHYNHPAIIIWGCLNEAASDCEEGAAVYQKHFDYFSRDKSRLSTYASNKHLTDMCLGMEDICSFNMYPGWYGDEGVQEEVDKVRKHMERTGNQDKPLIISEYGGGAIYNFHDMMRVKWSEEYQADLLRHVTSEFLKRTDLAGIFIWQFCDTRISQEGSRNWPMTRPKSRNNKGVVDEYRRPKMAFEKVKKLFFAE